MTKASRQPMLLGTALMFLAAGTLFGCKDSFLTDAAAAQGVLDSSVLANAAGVEGNLIATYRQLSTGFGNAASNWIWGSVTSDDAYKGSDATDFTASEAHSAPPPATGAGRAFPVMTPTRARSRAISRL